MSIGTKLKALRIMKKSTQQEAAANIGITKSALAMYERDERIPRDEIKIRIADYYGESVQSIFLVHKSTKRALQAMGGETYGQEESEKNTPPAAGTTGGAFRGRNRARASQSLCCDVRDLRPANTGRSWKEPFSQRDYPCYAGESSGKHPDTYPVVPPA